MTSIAQSAHAASLARSITALFGTVALRVKHVIRVHNHRRDAERLAAFDDRMLADIGLTRGDLRDAFAEPLWRDPTSVLRQRARERRAYRGRSAGLIPQLQAMSSPPLAPEHAFRRPPTDRPARLAV